MFRRRRWFQGRSIRGEGQDIGWFTPGGEEMTDEDWAQGYARSLGVYLDGDGIASLDGRGNRIIDDSFFLFFNAHHEPIDFALPERANVPERWQRVFDSAADDAFDAGPPVVRGTPLRVAERSLVVLRAG